MTSTTKSRPRPQVGTATTADTHTPGRGGHSLDPLPLEIYQMPRKIKIGALCRAGNELHDAVQSLARAYREGTPQEVDAAIDVMEAADRAMGEAFEKTGVAAIRCNGYLFVSEARRIEKCFHTHFRELLQNTLMVEVDVSVME